MFRFEEWESEREERKKERKEGRKKERKEGRKKERKREREKERKKEKRQLLRFALLACSLARRRKIESFFARFASLRSLEGNNKKPLRSLRFAPLEGTKEKKTLTLKNVYLRFFVRKPRSSARLKSLIALLRNPACLASSRDISVNTSATAGLLFFSLRPSSL